jgi:DNA polymerase elongation subunit (family B)
MLTWSAKWLYGTNIMKDKITPHEVKRFNDYRIVKSLWDLVNEADIVIAHYGDNFDIPILNSRAIINGLPPFSIVNTIDTKKVASKQFRFPSNKLDALGEYFGVGKKIKTDFSLWKRCLNGEQSAIDEMSIYNDHDVVLLEEVYLKLRPYIKSHPNVGLYLESDVPVCASCGNNHLHIEGNYYTNTGRYTVYRCECGSMSRVRTDSYSKELKRQLLTCVAK